MLPSTTGGANWQGGALDPETNIAVRLLGQRRSRTSGWSQSDGKRSDMAYIRGTAPNPAAPPRSAAGRGRRRR